jgi:uncharacterized membrane protein/mono/diheme cytochrome c family protein
MPLLLNIPELIGRFHPVLVHLPIGILILAVAFYYMGFSGRFKYVQAAVGISLLLGALAAIAACITGWLLASGGDYNEATVSQHQWMGIAVAAIALLTYYLHQKNTTIVKWLMPLIGVLITVTGHWGGSLTHGDGYLTQALLSNDKNPVVNAQPIADVQQAIVYNQIVQPILQSKCYNCHGSAKQKGKLRLDDSTHITKGGENGKVIVAAQPGESELIKRILLPKENDQHMPPRQKPQLTRAEIELLHWWVATGADYHSKTAALQPTEKVKPYLAALQQGMQQADANPDADVPEAAVAPAPLQTIQQLAALQVAVLPVAKGSNYLSINFVAADSVTQQHIALLQALSKQVVWLKLGYTQLNKAAIAIIDKLPALTRLYLNNSNITDNDMRQWNNLKQLRYLNVTATAISAAGIAHLKNATQLKQLYVHNSAVQAKDVLALKKIFPSATIDTGGYTLPLLTTDTSIVRAKLKKA